MPGIEVIPSAKRLIRSLRDIGYDFYQAVADIVDNSIEAGATRVMIDVEFEGDDSWVRIADNGRGMKPNELREAMRFGTERDYNVDELGKFGLGLKTASMSQCQCLSVASRWNPDRADIAAYSWDLSHIERTNRWEILPIDHNGLGPTIRQPLIDSAGTVVLWRRIDRILGNKHPYAEAARKRLSLVCRDLELHLAMVFHKFLAGEICGKRFKLLLNGNEIIPWDPFCRAESKVKALQPIPIPIEYEGVSGTVLFEPYILPNQDNFSSPDAFRAASGPANWNQQQGFYIYRAGRMIQSGGWSYLHAPDEHMKLARISVSFPPILDEAFKINVAKMRVQMPAQIRDKVKDAISPVRKLARETYDRKIACAPQPVQVPMSDSEVPAPLSTTSSTMSLLPVQMPLTDGPTKSSVLTFEEWARCLLTKCTKSERRLVKKILYRFKKSLLG